jgi:hypothetical protein
VQYNPAVEAELYQGVPKKVEGAVFLPGTVGGERCKGSRELIARASHIGNVKFKATGYHCNLTSRSNCKTE